MEARLWLAMACAISLSSCTSQKDNSAEGGWWTAVNWPGKDMCEDGATRLSEKRVDNAAPKLFKAFAPHTFTDLEVNSAHAFAALKSDGSVVAWGNLSAGGDIRDVSSQLSEGVVSISSSARAFAALKSDGSVVTWGDPDYGGTASFASKQLLKEGVVNISSNARAFAALKSDGSVVTWGDADYGGDQNEISKKRINNVKSIVPNDDAFAVLKTDGSVKAWGNAQHGGDTKTVSSSLLKGVRAIFAGLGTFAALKSDGSLVTWGNPMFGGNSSGLSVNLNGGVSDVVSGCGIFAALKTDGSVVSWGAYRRNKDGVLNSDLLTSGVTKILSLGNCNFAAVRSDGTVVEWGKNLDPKLSDLSQDISQNVTQIVFNRFAFAGLKADSSVVTWGDKKNGGDKSSVASELSAGVLKIFPLEYESYAEFVALTVNGTIVKWGEDPLTDFYERSWKPLPNWPPSMPAWWPASYKEECKNGTWTESSQIADLALPKSAHSHAEYLESLKFELNKDPFAAPEETPCGEDEYECLGPAPYHRACGMQFGCDALGCSCTLRFKDTVTSGHEQSASPPQVDEWSLSLASSDKIKVIDALTREMETRLVLEVDEIRRTCDSSSQACRAGGRFWQEQQRVDICLPEDADLEKVKTSMKAMILACNPK